MTNEQIRTELLRAARCVARDSSKGDRTVKRILICGDREWNDDDMVFGELRDAVLDDAKADALRGRYLGADVMVIEGEARGADTAALKAAQRLEDYGVRLMRFPAHWAHHFHHHEKCERQCPRPLCQPGCRQLVGKPAGVTRNQQMLDEGRPTEVWAFHDDLDRSKGTADMVARAEKAGIPVMRFKHGLAAD